MLFCKVFEIFRRLCVIHEIFLGPIWMILCTKYFVIFLCFIRCVIFRAYCEILCSLFVDYFVQTSILIVDFCLQKNPEIFCK